MRILILDNHDSFTFNLFQLLAVAADEEPVVVENDACTWSELQREHFDAVVISPGPGRPERWRDFGVCGDVLTRARVPILGVCLGHQGIACVFGGRTVHAPEVMHGRTSRVSHSGDGLFRGIPREFDAVRYHSLVAQRPLPAELVETAWTADGVLMGLRHRSRPIWGVQFHPESICSEHGARLLRNFVELAAGEPRAPGSLASVCAR